MVSRCSFVIHIIVIRTKQGESTVFEPQEGVYLERYWIDLRDQ